MDDLGNHRLQSSATLRSAVILAALAFPAAVESLDYPEPVLTSLHAVKAVAYSPDGELLASGSGDNTVMIWNARNGRLERTVKGCGSKTLAVAFSHDNNWLAIGGPDRCPIILWNLHFKEGEKVKLLSSIQDGRVTSLAFSPDGKFLASGSWDKMVKLWDVQKKNIRLQKLLDQDDRVESVAFSPDGRQLAWGLADGRARVWTVNSRQFPSDYPQEFDPKYGPIRTVVFSPDGKFLATGSGLPDNEIRLWGIGPGNPPPAQVIGKHGYEVDSISFSPDGKVILSSSWDNTIRLWDIASSSEIARLSDYGRNIGGVAFSPDGRHFASGTGNRNVKLWEWNVHEATASVVSDLKGYAGWVLSVAFSPDGKYLAGGSADGGIRLWDAQSGGLIRILRKDGEEPGDVNSAIFSPDSNQLAAGFENGTLVLWDMDSYKVTELPGPRETIWSVAYSMDGKTLAAGSSDGKIWVWDIRSRRQTRILKGHRCAVKTVAFSPDGKLLATGSDDSQIIIWNTNSWSRKLMSMSEESLRPGKINEFSEIEEIIGEWGATPRAAVDPQKLVDYFDQLKMRYLTKDSGRKLVALTDLIAGDQKREGLASVAFSSDSRLLAAGYLNQVDVWDVKAGTILAKIPKQGPVRSVVFSPDGRQLASAAADGTLKVWNWDAQKGIWNLEADLQSQNRHGVGIRSVAFSANGDFLAAGSEGGTIKIWNRAHWSELATLLAFDGEQWLAFTPDCYYKAGNCYRDGPTWPVALEQCHINRSHAQYGKFCKEQPGSQALDISSEAVTDVVSFPPAPQITITSPAAGSPVNPADVRLQYKIDLDSDENEALLNAEWTEFMDSEGAWSTLTGELNLSEKPKADRKNYSSVPYRIPMEKIIVSTGGPNEINRIRVSARSNLGVTSTAEVRFKAAKPKLYVLAVGVNNGRDGLNRLDYAVADATGVADAVVSQTYLYSDVSTKALVSNNATREEILKTTLDDGFFTDIHQEDVAIIFLSGHGVVNKKGVYSFVTADGSLNDESPNNLDKNDITVKLLGRLSEKVDKIVLLLDSCHAGAVVGSGKEKGDDVDRISSLLSAMSNVKGIAVLWATSATTVIREDVGHGSLAKALLEVLGNSPIDNFMISGSDSNVVTIGSLFSHIKERIDKHGPRNAGDNLGQSPIPPDLPLFYRTP